MKSSDASINLQYEGNDFEIFRLISPDDWLELDCFGILRSRKWVGLAEKSFRFIVTPAVRGLKTIHPFKSRDGGGGGGGSLATHTNVTRMDFAAAYRNKASAKNSSLPEHDIKMLLPGARSRASIMAKIWPMITKSTSSGLETALIRSSSGNEARGLTL